MQPHTGSTVCLLRTSLSKSLIRVTLRWSVTLLFFGQTRHIANEIVTGVASTCFARLLGISSVIASKRILGMRGLATERLRFWSWWPPPGTQMWTLKIISLMRLPANRFLLADVSPAPAESVSNIPPFSTLIGPPPPKRAGIQIPNSVFSGPAVASDQSVVDNSVIDENLSKVIKIFPQF